MSVAIAREMQMVSLLKDLRKKGGRGSSSHGGHCLHVFILWPPTGNLGIRLDIPGTGTQLSGVGREGPMSSRQGEG